MKNVLLMASLCLIFSISGCATSGNGCCGTGQTGIFGQNRIFQNQPVRDSIRSWFQGDSCSTCNPPSGIPNNYDSNVAPICNACGNTLPITDGAAIGQGISLYDNGGLNGSITSGTITNGTITNYPNLNPPLIDSGANLGTPTGSIDAGYGEIPMDEIPTPNF